MKNELLLSSNVYKGVRSNNDRAEAAFDSVP